MFGHKVQPIRMEHSARVDQKQQERPFKRVRNGLRSLPKWPLKCRRKSSAKNYEQEIHWSFQKKRQVSQDAK